MSGCCVISHVKIEIEVLPHIVHMMWRAIICCTQEWVAKLGCFLNELSFLAFVLVCQAIVFSLMVWLCRSKLRSYYIAYTTYYAYHT